MRLCPAIFVLALFITIDQVELKKTSGEWVSVTRPDRRLDITQEEPAIRFFNNGRIPPGDYSNVRVHFTAEEETRKQLTLERVEDYAPALAIKKGSFIGVTFSFDWMDGERISDLAFQRGMHQIIDRLVGGWRTRLGERLHVVDELDFEKRLDAVMRSLSLPV